MMMGWMDEKDGIERYESGGVYIYDILILMVLSCPVEAVPD
jgi:hypothetical protein